jgi:hypothetical protein
VKTLITLAVAATVAITACGGTEGSSTVASTVQAATARLELIALAGPVCPVESDPPSPDCAPRAVGGAFVIVTDVRGSEVARGATAVDGTLVLDVPAGELTVTPQPVEGLVGTAPPMIVTIAAGQTLQLTADYDTGIR